MIIWYVLGFVALVAFLIWAGGKLEEINERNERKAAESRRRTEGEK